MVQLNDKWKTNNETFDETSVFHMGNHPWNEAFLFMEVLLGKWKVETKDRTAPDAYEMNNGHAEMTLLIDGCRIRESFRGTYKNGDYAREVSILGIDSTGSFRILLLFIDRLRRNMGAHP